MAQRGWGWLTVVVCATACQDDALHRVPVTPEDAGCRLGALTPAVEFAETPVGAMRTESAVVKNFGKADCELREARITSGSEAFLVWPDGLPAIVASGASIELAVGYLPPTSEGHDGRLEVRYGAAYALESGESALEMQLLGKVPEVTAVLTPDGGLEATPGALPFGDVAVGCVEGPLAVVLKNLGDIEVTVTSLTIDPGDAPFAVSAPPLPITILPDESIVLGVTFLAAVEGDAEAHLVVTRDDGEELRVRLTGDAEVPSNIDFGLDSDSDEWPDFAEDLAGSSPWLPADTPATHDHYVFIMPFADAPRPGEATVRAGARLARADVVFLMDTSGSMYFTIDKLPTQFHNMVAALTRDVDDLAFGAAGFADFPAAEAPGSYYTARDLPFYRVHRVMTVRTAAGMASVSNALSVRDVDVAGVGPWFAMMNGGDEPETGWEALRQTLTGVGIDWGTGAVPPALPDGLYPATVLAGEEGGVRGGLGFRPDALPIVIMVTDARSQDPSLVSSTPAGATRATALQAATDMGAKVIGVMAWSLSPQADLDWIANHTGAKVPPSAWGVPPERPANCPEGKCCLLADTSTTSGPPLVQPDPVDGECTLVFRSDSAGERLETIMTRGLGGLVRGGRMNVTADVVDEPVDLVNTRAAFVQSVEIASGASCNTGTALVDTDGDGVLDTATGVLPGSNVCFRVRLKHNATVAPASVVRYYPARLVLRGDGIASLRSYDITFVVPPRPGGTCH